MEIEMARNPEFAPFLCRNGQCPGIEQARRSNSGRARFSGTHDAQGFTLMKHLLGTEVALRVGDRFDRLL
ncbi:hypothetical protein FAZ69_18650 [Trinickia terrae]|uniref:Uncharacterized protein n=1 Tax=Trinickia terrae TaxID=2571161 RepID=A0A4U1I0M8_9BURK|nr:hypothetical protein [Trinickia terrae]TKC86677.1 hypothetical protein FAZ69_18650 [Trinickia terrae]